MSMETHRQRLTHSQRPPLVARQRGIHAQPSKIGDVTAPALGVEARSTTKGIK